MPGIHQNWWEEDPEKVRRANVGYGNVDTYTPPNPQYGLRGVNYSTYVPDAFKRYMDMIYGKEGTAGYIKGQVRGTSEAMQPYMTQMSTQGAAGISARGGLGSGAQDYLQSTLQGQKIGALQGAATQAQQDVTRTGVAAAGLAQGEGFNLSDDEIQRFLAALTRSKFDWQKYMDQKGLDRQSRQDTLAFIADILGSVGQVAGAYAPKEGG